MCIDSPNLAWVTTVSAANDWNVCHHAGGGAGGSNPDTEPATLLTNFMRFPGGFLSMDHRSSMAFS